MKKFSTSFKILTVLALFIFSYEARALDITSPDITPNSAIGNFHVFNSFGCKGKNISPIINWSNAPLETKSFAFTVYDPDAPTGSGWWHWLLVNIAPAQSGLVADFGKEDKFDLAGGIKQVRNDFGGYKFGGPCPPVGDKPHRYIFTIYALKVDKIEISSSATAALAGYMINQNVIEKKSFEAFYGR